MPAAASATTTASGAAGAASGTPTASEAITLLSQALAASATGDSSGIITDAQVSQAQGQTQSLCSTVTSQTDEAGKALGLEISLGTATTTDLSQVCASATPTVHYMVIGTDAYIEQPAGSGTWEHATTDASILASLDAFSGADAAATAQGLLGAASTVELGDQPGTVVVTYSDNAAIAKLLEANGQDPAGADSIESGTVTTTYHIDPSTGKVTQTDSVNDMTIQGDASHTESQSLQQWQDVTLTAPQGAAETGQNFATIQDLVQAAWGRAAS